MSRHTRYRLPNWARHCVFVIEKATLPILIFQLIRTLLFPSTLDIFILGILIGIFIVFYLEWI